MEGKLAAYDARFFLCLRTKRLTVFAGWIVTSR
jgi:hypothetical protein